MSRLSAGLVAVALLLPWWPAAAEAGECTCRAITVFAKASGDCTMTDTPAACEILFPGNKDCDCEVRKGTARASGTCARTEDPSGCSIVFTDGPGPPPAETFERSLRDLGVSADPLRALVEASTVPPEKWRAPGEFLLVLAASSMYTRHFNVNEIKADLLAPRVLAAVQNPQLRREGLAFGDGVSASYGCVSVTKSSLSVLVRTRWSTATRACNVFGIERLGAR